MESEENRTELYYNSGRYPTAYEVHAVLQYTDKMGFTGDHFIMC